MLYKFGQCIFFVYYHLFFRLKVEGKENIPESGPIIICSNHTSNNDPMLLGACIKRPVHFIAKSELYSNRFFSFILKGINTIPVKRDSPDMSTYKHALDVLKKGEALGIFAQGGRVKEDEEKEAKAGVALFALKGGADVVPVKITSKYRLFSKITVNIGKPVNMEIYKDRKVKSDTLREIADDIMKNISEL